MIYEPVPTDSRICQGDIFCDVPRVDFKLSSLPTISSDETGARQITWLDALKESEGGAVSAILSITPVSAIVITQNCDAGRGRDLCLCQIDEFLAAVGQETAPKNDEKWQSLITRTAREMPRMFYLPPAELPGFKTAMAADLRTILRVPREDLEDLRVNRACRLNSTASEHFREVLAHFFRRYAYNEWYPLTKAQFDAYASKLREQIEPYPHQR